MTDQTLLGSYDYRLVVLSVLIAILASYTALDLAGRVTASWGWPRLAWLISGATSMGAGIWSMHYIGMLAFGLPVQIQYDWPNGPAISLRRYFLFSRSPSCGQPAKDGAAEHSGGQHLHGQWDRGHALHRNVFDAPGCHVPLFSLARGSFGPARNRGFLDGLIASVLLSGRGAGPVEAEDGQRVADGGRYRRHALYRHGRCQLHLIFHAAGPRPRY